MVNRCCRQLFTTAAKDQEQGLHSRITRKTTPDHSSVTRRIRNVRLILAPSTLQRKQGALLRLVQETELNAAACERVITVVTNAIHRPDDLIHSKPPATLPLPQASITTLSILCTSISASSAEQINHMRHWLHTVADIRRQRLSIRCELISQASQATAVPLSCNYAPSHIADVLFDQQAVIHWLPLYGSWGGFHI